VLAAVMVVLLSMQAHGNRNGRATTTISVDPGAATAPKNRAGPRPPSNTQEAGGLPDTAATSRLTPELRQAVTKAIAAAAAQGVVLQVTSGWRSLRRQRQLFDQAVRTYGSVRAARFSAQS
jgi:hypothetical protein